MREADCVRCVACRSRRHHTVEEDVEVEANLFWGEGEEEGAALESGLTQRRASFKDGRQSLELSWRGTLAFGFVVSE